MRRSLCSFAAAALLLVAGCAALRPPSVPTGASMAEVEGLLGRPKDVVAGPGGVTEWQYPTGPVGQTTFMVRFGADERTKAAYQALTFEQFAKVRRGISRDEVRLLLGPPGQTMFFVRMNEEVWSYRYQAAASDNRIFNVHMDATTGYVRTTSEQMDPLLNPWNMDAPNGT